MSWRFIVGNKEHNALNIACSELGNRCGCPLELELIDECSHVCEEPLNHSKKEFAGFCWRDYTIKTQEEFMNALAGKD